MLKSSPQPVRLLLVEDDPGLREVRELLVDAGFDVTLAVDGADALRRLTHSDHVDAVVLDHEMPRLKGQELLSALRRAGNHVPVVLCSASLQLSRGDCSRLGISGVLLKPFGQDELVLAIRKALAGDA
jgi:CheY-like chemotaxis protein